MNRSQKRYLELKTSLGRRPTRAEMYLKLGKKFDRYLRRGWLAFLAGSGELDPEEMRFVGTAAEKFLMELETTKFDKSYRIPAVLAFVTWNGVRSSVHLTDIGRNLSDFYYHLEDHQLDLRDKSSRDWRYWGINEFTNLAWKNPVKYLVKSRFFHYDKHRQLLQLDRSLNEYLNLTLAAHIKDIMEYRRLKYFEGHYRVDLLEEVATVQVTEEAETEAGVKVYQKLVRDRIPELIEAQGKKCEVKTLSDDDEYLLELNWKLQDELTEYLESGTVEELADLVEVAQALLKLKGISKKKFEKIIAKKQAEWGGFEERIMLVKVEES